MKSFLSLDMNNDAAWHVAEHHYEEIKRRWLASESGRVELDDCFGTGKICVELADIKALWLATDSCLTAREEEEDEKRKREVVYGK